MCLFWIAFGTAERDAPSQHLLEYVCGGYTHLHALHNLQPLCRARSTVNNPSNTFCRMSYLLVVVGRVQPEQSRTIRQLMLQQRHLQGQVAPSAPHVKVHLLKDIDGSGSLWKQLRRSTCGHKHQVRHRSGTNKPIDALTGAI